MMFGEYRSMHAEKHGYLRLHFNNNRITAFFPLLQQGFSLEIAAGNVNERLCQICDMDPETLRSLIQTVLLNGKPVDDMTKASIQSGDCLALSAAMPGLVGATMRSGGILAGFRRTISHRTPQTRSDTQNGVLTIKLFNLLLKDIGPRLLQKGILVELEAFRNLLSSFSKADWNDCETSVLNDQSVPPDTLADMVWPQGRGYMHLRVTFGRP
jgi:hypothetical protein